MLCLTVDSFVVVVDVRVVVKSSAVKIAEILRGAVKAIVQQLGDEKELQLMARKF